MSELDRLLAEEIAADAARHEMHQRETARHAGVSWSGLEPGRPPAATLEAQRVRAAARLAERRAWRESADGTFLEAVASCQAAAREAFCAAERARAGANRGEPLDWKREVLAEIAFHLAALSTGVAQARRTLAG